MKCVLFLSAGIRRLISLLHVCFKRGAKPRRVCIKHFGFGKHLWYTPETVSFTFVQGLNNNKMLLLLNYRDVCSLFLI